MRLSWVHPEIAAAARDALLAGCDSWEDAFTTDDAVLFGVPPAGVLIDNWPRLAEHVARAERVREAIATHGREHAVARFGHSPHAVERAALAADQGNIELDAAAELEGIVGVLACDIDEQLIYGHFLSRLVELKIAADPAGVVEIFERFVAAARGIVTDDPTWPERLRVAEDALAGLYVRVDRVDDAEAVFQERFDSEPGDATVAITAARAFLEHGDVSRAVAWLERGAARARKYGRAALADTLDSKARSLRARLS